MRQFTFLLFTLLIQSGFANEAKISPDIRNALKKAGCEIPKEFPESNSFVVGNFAGPGTKDTAAFCKRGKKLFVYLVWKNAKPCPTEFSVGEMGDYALDIASKDTILGHQKAYGGPLPKNLNHDGIDFSIIDRASVVYYCDEGKWKELQGSD